MLRILKSSLFIFVVIGLLLTASCRSKGPYNPYLKMKKKPSDILREGDKKVVKKGNRRYKRQLGNNRKKLFGRRKAPGM
jgi:hypothetical protein